MARVLEPAHLRVQLDPWDENQKGTIHERHQLTFLYWSTGGALLN